MVQPQNTEQILYVLRPSMTLHGEKMLIAYASHPLEETTHVIRLWYPPHKVAHKYTVTVDSSSFIGCTRCCHQVLIQKGRYHDGQEKYFPLHPTLWKIQASSQLGRLLGYN